MPVGRIAPAMKKLSLLPCIGVSALSLFVWLACSGCTRVRSEIAAFHALPSPVAPMTYQFQPLPDQESSLEYGTYCNLIRQELSRYGFQEAPADQATATVGFAYGISGPSQKIVSSPVYGQTGVSSSHTSGHITATGNSANFHATTQYTPKYGITGYETESITQHTRYLKLIIAEKKNSPDGKLKVLYEATVSSTGSSGQLPEVMPAMIKSLFEEFPGKSGKVRKVTLSL